MDTSWNRNLSSNREGGVVTATASLGHHSPIPVDSSDASSLPSERKGHLVTQTAALVIAPFESSSPTPTPAVSLRTGMAAWSTRQPASVTTSVESPANPAAPPASLRAGRAQWSLRQPALAINPFEPSSAAPTPAVSLCTGMAAWSPRQPALAITHFRYSSNPATPPLSLRIGRAAWSPQPPAPVTTSTEPTPAVSLRTGRAFWSRPQAPSNSLWENGALWSHRKSYGSLEAPPGSRTSNGNTDCKTWDHRFSSQTAFYGYFMTTIEFDWAGEAQKLNQEARLLELLHALEPVFQKQEQRYST